MTTLQAFFADAFIARASLIKSTRQATGRNARRLARKHKEHTESRREPLGQDGNLGVEEGNFDPGRERFGG